MLDIIIVFLIWATERIERYHCFLPNCCFGVCGEGWIISMYVFPTVLDLSVHVLGYAIISEFKNPLLCPLLEINFTQQRNCASLRERLLSQVIWLCFWKCIPSHTSLNTVSFSLTCFFHSSIDCFLVMCRKRLITTEEREFSFYSPILWHAFPIPICSCKSPDKLLSQPEKSYLLDLLVKLLLPHWIVSIVFSHVQYFSWSLSCY